MKPGMRYRHSLAPWHSWKPLLHRHEVIIGAMAGILIAALVIIGGAILWSIRPAHSHDWKRPDFDNWYSSLRRPGVNSYFGGSIGCCGTTDCHETEAEMRGNDWWARLGKQVTLSSGKHDWELQDWVKIPPHLVLQKQNNPTGSAVICHSVNLQMGGMHVSPDSPVYCFVPPSES